MNYIAELNAFYDWLLYNPLPTGAIALWYALMSVNNKANWADEFTVANLVLQGMTGLSRQGLDKARNLLIQKGLIQYKKGTSNQAGKYKMISFDRKKVGTVVDTAEKNKTAECKKVGTVVDTAGAQQLSQEGHSSSTLFKQNKTKQNETIDDDYVDDPIKFYVKHIGPLLPMVSDLINQYSIDLPDELLTEAMRIAVAHNKRSLKYIEKIWINWIDNGIKTFDDYKRAEAEWESRKTAQNARAPTSTGGLNKKLDFAKFPQHEYTEAELESLYENIGN